MVAALAANAQNRHPQLGIIAGLNFASQTSDVDDEKSTSKSRTGLAIGVFTELPAGKNFSIQPGLLYSSLGGHDEDQSIKVTTKFNYLMLPVLAKINLKAVNIYAGPQLGYLLNAKIKIDYNGENMEADATKEFKRMDFFAVFGAELNLSKSIALGANYQAGLANIFKDDEYGSSYTNNNMQVSLAWKFTK